MESPAVFAPAVQVGLLKRKPLWGRDFQRLMRSLVVVKANPVFDHLVGMQQGLESVIVFTLVFEGSDRPLGHAVLLRAVRRDEFLPQAIALDQRRVATAGEHQLVVRPHSKNGRMTLPKQLHRGRSAPAPEPFQLF